MFKSLSHFEFISVHGVRVCSSFIDSHAAVWFSQHHLLERLSSPHFIFLPSLSKIISIDAEKAIDRVQHPFMIKTLNKVGTDGTYLNIIKAISDKPHSKYNTQWRKAESFPTKIWNRTRMPTLTTFIQHSLRSPSHSNQTNKRNKRHPYRKRRDKTHYKQMTWYYT